MKSLAGILLLTIAIGCGGPDDPPFATETGDLGLFLHDVLSENGSSIARQTNYASLPELWRWRRVTKKHDREDILRGREDIQIFTEGGQREQLEAFFTASLGAPTMAGERACGWPLTQTGTGVWLWQTAEGCGIEIAIRPAERHK